MIPPLVDLWRYNSQRCVMTAERDGPPFHVGLYNGELTLHVFVDHDAAISFAVEALRVAMTEGEAPLPEVRYTGRC